MSTGYLLFPPGYHPLISGAVVPSGKLNFTRTGTTTAQDTYTDADLSVANANPVVLNATGGLDTHVYLDPSTGYRYRCRVYSSADVLLDTFDDLLGFGADTANYSEGSFTGTLTGYASGPTGTVNYRIVQNSAGTGKLCVLYTAAAITGTSNATSLTLTGLPAACQPTLSAVWATGGCMMTDSGAVVRAEAVVGGSTITFYTDEPPLTTGWTGSGTKGTALGTTIAYPL